MFYIRTLGFFVVRNTESLNASIKRSKLLKEEQFAILKREKERGRGEREKIKNVLS